MPFTCGHHRAVVYERGGLKAVGELTPLEMVRWNRKRDDISDAQVNIGTTQCCDLLGDLRTVKHELHILRDDVSVWEGVITRLEYEWDQVRVYASDMLWPSTRTVIRQGYKQAYPNLTSVVTRMDWLIRNQCFSLNGDPWRMVPHLHPIHSEGESKSSRNVAAYQFYVWEDFDKYAEDSGADYTVVNREVYYWDLNLRWKIIAPLDEQYLSQFPRITEYGNQAATRGYVSNSEGYAGIAEAPAAWVDEYGYIDWLVGNTDDQGDDETPDAEEIAEWSKTAGRNINGRYPPPVAVVIPANTTLLPGSPWEMSDLFPGAWFLVNLTRMCRRVSEWQRIHEVVVEESAPDGERVNFTAVSSPSAVVDPQP